MTEQQADLIPTRPGARLRHERVARGLSTEQIADKTRIRERIILAIERDDTDAIAPVYLRGYVKAYAISLGLDPAELEQEARATSSPDPELRSVFGISRKRGFGERWLKAGSYLVATALIAALVWQVTQQAVQFSQGRSDIANSEPAQSVPGGGVSADQRSAETGTRQSTHHAASIASLEKIGKRPGVTGAAAEQAWSAINQPLTADDGRGVIGITVSADSWVEIVDATGTQLEMDLLRGGNQRSYSGEPPFEIMLGRASSVVVEYQGQPVDITPHIRGDVARLTLGTSDSEQP